MFTVNRSGPSPGREFGPATRGRDSGEITFEARFNPSTHEDIHVEPTLHFDIQETAS